MNKPNFLIVGAAKAGTTYLYSILKQHPEIYLPDIKECRYYSNIGEKNIIPYTSKPVVSIENKEVYYSLFDNVDQQKAIGEISPDYLYYYKESIKNIKNELGTDVKIIIILRNPVERAYSAYYHLVRLYDIKNTFLEVLSSEKEWVKTNIWWGCFVAHPGYYYDAVNEYLKYFANTKVLLFEDLVGNQDETLESILSFLEVDSEFNFEKPTFLNKTGRPKSIITKKIINISSRFINKLGSFIPQERLLKLLSYIEKQKERNLYKPDLERDEKNMLINLYNNDIKDLAQLINRDLSTWVEPN